MRSARSSAWVDRQARPIHGPSQAAVPTCAPGTSRSISTASRGESSCAYDCLRSIAVDIARWVPRLHHAHPGSLAPSLLRMSFASLYLHEVYHHKTEAHAIRLAVVERKPCYRRYWNSVYAPVVRPSGGGALEEALANADSYRRLGEQTYRRFVADPIYRAAEDYLRWRFPLDPPGYLRDAPAYLRDVDNEAGQNMLKSQVQEAVARPYRTLSQWRLAPNMNESLFGITSDIWVVVPPGARPTLPTFPLYRPASTTKLVALAQARVRLRRGQGRQGLTREAQGAADRRRSSSQAAGRISRRSCSRASRGALGYRDPGRATRPSRPVVRSVSAMRAGSPAGRRARPISLLDD